MNGLSVTILVACFCIVIAGLFAVIVERTNERDEARAEAERAGRERDEECEVRRRTEHAFAAFKLDLEAKGTRVVTPIRRELRSVPNEPTPIHDEVLVDAWIDHVQAWGEDVES